MNGIAKAVLERLTLLAIEVKYGGVASREHSIGELSTRVHSSKR